MPNRFRLAVLEVTGSYLAVETSVGQVLINALTGKVGPVSQVTGYPTYHESAEPIGHFPVLLNSCYLTW